MVHLDTEVLQQWDEGGRPGPKIATVKVCWAADEEEAKKTAHRLWRSSGIPGQASQELSMPAHFDEASELVTPDAIAEKIACGPDPEVHLELIRKYVDAGFDEIHLGQVGDDQEGFFRFWQEELEPALSEIE